MSPRRSAALAALALAVLTAACGSSHSATSAAASSGGIGGSVSSNLGTEPSITVPTTPAPNHLETRDIVVGTGAVASATSTVTVQYLGVNYANGKPFDSSWQRGQPATFSLQQVVPGFAQGIVGMRVGGRREIVIPPALGYGSQGAAPAIAPGETLVFVVDLLKVG